MDAPADAVRTLDRWVFAWCALSHRAKRWQAELDSALRPHGLAGMELLVLWRTGHAMPPGISQVELSRELNLSPPQVCGVVDTLQGRGWLQTERPREDRRRLYCSLTASGRAELQRLVVLLSPMAQRCLREESPVWSDGPRTGVDREEAA